MYQPTVNKQDYPLGYTCLICNKMFCDKTNFDNHLITHDIEQIMIRHAQNVPANGPYTASNAACGSFYNADVNNVSSNPIKTNEDSVVTTKDQKCAMPENSPINTQSCETKPVKCSQNESNETSNSIMDNSSVAQPQVRQSVARTGGLLKLYPCDECSKSYTRRDHLTRHKITHTGFRPFTCQDCGKAFYRKDKLQRHERTHLRETALFCKVCGKQFTRKDRLHQHEKTHETKFSGLPILPPAETSPGKTSQLPPSHPFRPTLPSV